jgi:Ca2+-binding EF-hand superfamily protein
MMMRMMPVLAALDADGDGKISSAEIDSAPAALRKLDKNDDGDLTAEEMRPDFAAMRGRGPGGGPGRFGPGGPPGGGPPPREREGGFRDRPEAMVDRVMQLDKNDDGKLTKEEIGDRMRGLFDRADENEDGEITREELNAMAARMPARPDPRGGFRRGPRDGDGPRGERDRPRRQRPEAEDAEE